MTEPVKLDLRELTQAHVDEAFPHIGECYYSSPCIIGTLIPKDRRAEFDNENYELRTPGGWTMDNLPMVGELVSQDLIEFPDDVQAGLATTLQRAFDDREKGPSRFAAALSEVNQALGLNLKVPA